MRALDGTLCIDPCIPRDCTRCSVIDVRNSAGVARGVAAFELDGAPVPGAARLILSDQNPTHHVRVMLGAPAHHPGSCGN